MEPGDSRTEAGSRRGARAARGLRSPPARKDEFPSRSSRPLAPPRLPVPGLDHVSFLHPPEPGIKSPAASSSTKQWCSSRSTCSPTSLASASEWGFTFARALSAGARHPHRLQPKSGCPVHAGVLRYLTRLSVQPVPPAPATPRAARGRVIHDEDAGRGLLPLFLQRLDQIDLPALKGLQLLLQVGYVLLDLA